MVANLLTAASILLAGEWRMSHAPSLEKRKERTRYMFSMAKLPSVVKYKNGNLEAIQQFCKQWTPFIKHIITDSNNESDWM